MFVALLTPNSFLLSKNVW